MIEVFTALPNDVDQIWPRIAEGMQKSCRTGSFTAGHLWQICRSGNAFLIIAHEGAEVLGASIVQFQDNGRTLAALGLCGKRLKTWWALLYDEVMRIAKHGGAERYIDDARPGMKAFYRHVPRARLIGMTFEVT